MANEIERKFLVTSDAWRDEVSESVHLVQAYLARGERSAIRVRIKGDTAELNIKQAVDGIHRLEFEYEIPLADAREMVDQVALRPLIDKTRHYLHHEGHLWEIDEFHAENAGLIVAEIELEQADVKFAKPSWLGKEVSHDKRYYNSCLSERPFNTW